MGINDSKLAAIQAHWQAVESEHPELAEMLHDYKVAQICDIDEAFEAFVDANGRDEMLIDLVDFEDAFDPVLSDSSMHFEFWTQFHGGGERVASPFAVFAALYLLGEKSHTHTGTMSIDAKLAKVLKLFDFDESEEFNLAECAACFEVVATMLKDIIREMGEEIEPDVKSVCNRLRGDLGLEAEVEVELERVRDWLAVQDDVCNLLKCITDMRLIQSEQKRVEEGIHHAGELFLQRASVDDKHITREQFVEILFELPGPRPTDEEVNVFADMVDSGSKKNSDNRIFVDEFITAMMPWVAFTVLDIDDSGTIDASELKPLLWVSRGVDSGEPSQSMIDRAMGAIDVDGSGLVERLEWIRWCSTCDMRTGGDSFGSAATLMWQQMDLDGSQNISVVEILQFFNNAVDELLQAIDATKLDDEEFMLNMRTLTKNAAEVAMGEMDVDHDGVVQWSGFQRFYDTMLQQKKALEQYVEVQVRSDNERDVELGLVQGKISVVHHKPNVHQSPPPKRNSAAAAEVMGAQFAAAQSASARRRTVA